jgi:Flp pilus assembly protein TadG
MMMGLTAVALFGIMGLALDVGRMYIAKSEAQTYADAGAIEAALRMNGTSAGIMTSAQLVAFNANRYALGNTAFTTSNVVLDYATAQTGPFGAGGTTSKFARVTATPSVNLYFLPILVRQTTTAVPAVAIANQVPITGTGLFPLAPIAASPTAVNYGYTAGGFYSLEWGSNPSHGNCANDTAAMIAVASNNNPNANWNSLHGYYDGIPGHYSNGPTAPTLINSTSDVVAQILGDYEHTSLVPGDNAPLNGGESRTAVNTNMTSRIQQDTDQTSATYAAYTGNGRRVITVPIICPGVCSFTSNGHTYTSNDPNSNLVMGYAPFFLLPASTLPSNGTQSFCAEYIGTEVKGSPNDQTLNPNGPGVYQVRLVQ